MAFDWQRQIPEVPSLDLLGPSLLLLMVGLQTPCAKMSNPFTGWKKEMMSREGGRGRFCVHSSANCAGAALHRGLQGARETSKE